MNYLMETLSLINNTLPEKDDNYRIGSISMLPEGIEADDKTIFPGRQTNEAPTKYFIWYLSQQKKMFDEIFVLVTDECINKNVNCLGFQKSTYQYYKDSIVDYLEKLKKDEEFVSTYLSEKYNGSAREYVEVVMKDIVVPSGVTAAEWKSIVSMISENGKKSNNIDIYVDFTGGSRLASLISLLLLRIIEIQNINVVRMIYSDITNRSDRKLVDCTESYKILSNIENIAKAESSKDDSTRKIISELIKMGLASEEDMEGTEELDKQITISETTLVKDAALMNSDKKKQQTGPAKKTSSIADSVKQKSVDRVQVNMNRSPFSKLSGRSDDSLIKDFHEEILSVMFGINIIKPKSGKDVEPIKNEIQANEMYYCFITGHNGRFSSGVIPFTRNLIKYMKEHPQFDPVKNFEHSIYNSKKIAEYFKSIQNKPSIIGVPSNKDESFLEFLKKFQSGTNDSKQLLDTYIVYYNYSFPYMCVGKGKKKIYPEIMNYYIDKVAELMKGLAELKNQDKDSYLNRLDTLLKTDNGELENAVPYMVGEDSWYVNTEKFSSREESERFLKDLLEKIAEVRPYRNAVAHNLNNKYNNIDEKKRMAKIIRNWLSEYERRFVLENKEKVGSNNT